MEPAWGPQGPVRGTVADDSLEVTGKDAPLFFSEKNAMLVLGNQGCTGAHIEGPLGMGSETLS